MRASNEIPFRRKIESGAKPAFFVERSRHLKKTMRRVLPFYLAPQWLFLLIATNLSLGAAYVSNTPESLPASFHSILSPLSTLEAVVATAPEPQNPSTRAASQPQRPSLSPREHRAAAFIAKRYHIAREAADVIVTEATGAAREYRVDPYLLLALIARESSFNPFAESSVGAMGLTQNLPEAHPEKISSLSSNGGHILDVRDNIRLGAQVLREYLNRFGGNEVLALQQYNGSLADPSRSYSKAILQLRTKMLQSI